MLKTWHKTLVYEIQTTVCLSSVAITYHFTPKAFFNVQFQKISILPRRKGFSFAPPVPSRNLSLASYFASKILACKTPFPLGISNDLPRGGYGFFLELFNDEFVSWFVIYPAYL